MTEKGEKRRSGPALIQLIYCNDCPELRRCASTLIHDLAVGVYRIYWCREHGLISIACLVATWRSNPQP